MHQLSVRCQCVVTVAALRCVRVGIRSAGAGRTLSYSPEIYMAVSNLIRCKTKEAEVAKIAKLYSQESEKKGIDMESYFNEMEARRRAYKINLPWVN